MAKIYIVDLTEEERTFLLELIKKGKHSARKINRGRILLLANGSRVDREIAEVLYTSIPTIQRTRRRFVEGNLEYALNEQRRCGRPKELDGKGEAVLIALAHSAPPAGRKSWTTQLLADRLVELKILGSVSDETVRRGLKKTISSPGWKSDGVSPPSAPSLCGAWKMFWTCTPSHMTPNDHKSASTRRWSN